MEKLSFQVAEMEGPLDLILQLIARHRLNIYDIEIDILVQQYLNAIEGISEDMDSASEFLEMASRLVYIKTVALLPKHEEETGRLKAELTGELLEYQACKQVARQLAMRYLDREAGLRSPTEPVMEEPPSEDIRLGAPEDLLRAYQLAAGRARKKEVPTQEEFEPLMSVHFVSVQSSMLRVLRKLYQNPVSDFMDLFEGAADRPHAVAVFLAVLELIKAGRLKSSILPDHTTQIELLRKSAEKIEENQ